jgi:ABC-type glycerol-3-phosphate transport system substrate-binding protein
MKSHGISPLLLVILAACALLGACSDSAAGPGVRTTPATATFVTSDVVHFWEAYDSGGENGVVSAFQTSFARTLRESSRSTRQRSIHPSHS